MKTNKKLSVEAVSTAACTTVYGTSCSTYPEQIEVMELEVYSRPTCDKLRAFSHDAFTAAGAIHKLDRRRVLSTIRSTCRGEIF